MAKIPAVDSEQLASLVAECTRELRESELYFRTMTNSGQLLIWTSGTDKTCDYFNLPWLKFTGRTLEQELGDGWQTTKGNLQREIQPESVSGMQSRLSLLKSMESSKIDAFLPGKR